MRLLDELTQGSPVHGRAVDIQYIHATRCSSDFAAGQIICFLLSLLLLPLLLGGLLQALLLSRWALAEGAVPHLALHATP